MLWVGCCAAFGQFAAHSDTNPAINNPAKALANLPSEGHKITLSKGRIVFPNGGHWQGIQSLTHKKLNQQICFLSRDSDTAAYFVTAVFDPGFPSRGEIRHFQALPSDGRQPPLRHAGGMQLIGDYLVIGVEDNQDKLRSQIQFWDVSKPLAPQLRVPLTVMREGTVPKDQTAGAVGIVKYNHHHLLVVANWDAEHLDFYASNGLPLGDDTCRFSFKVRWSQRQAHKHTWQPDQAWEGYQAINLMADRSDNVYLLGFGTRGEGEDVIDLFAIDLAGELRSIVQKVSRRHMNLQGNAHFRSAGGISVRSSEELSCFASEHRGDDTITIHMSLSE
ncbi:MAG: hypothetical protein GY809_25115 [Planctomycetes bacterium]|nr:hypothetical protein [Planctomycetota bacterium]